MRNQANKNFNDRRQDAAEAKKKLLEKFKKAPKADDPEMIAKRAEREAIAKAREERRAERERLKIEEQERKAAEAAAAAAAPPPPQPVPGMPPLPKRLAEAQAAIRQTSVAQEPSVSRMPPK